METSTARNIIMRAIVVVLCVVIALGMGAVTVSAADNHGRDAHSESMSVGPDGSKKGALEKPKDYKPSVDMDNLEPQGEPIVISSYDEEEPEDIEAVDDNEDRETEKDKEDKEDHLMDSRIMAAMIAAAATIAVCEYIKSRRNK